jgi:glycosyltransferase involved in cell wall biosynthesis
MNKPEVSVLMTIYNHQNYLKNSIKSIINQSYKNWELIAIDNGSTDNSAKILKKIKKKKIKSFFLKKNIGRTKCLNFGLKKCTGRFIAILDSDDLAGVNRIKIQINEFNLNKKLWMVASDYNFIDHKGKIISYPKVKVDLSKNLHEKPRGLLIKNFMAHSSVMYKSELVKKIGGYSQSLLYAADYAFFLKTFKRYKIKILDLKLVDIRAPHKTSETVRIVDTNRATTERINILLWNIYNFKTSLYEKFLILIQLILETVRFCVPKYLKAKELKLLIKK